MDGDHHAADGLRLGADRTQDATLDASHRDGRDACALWP
jgi:hypothetical protein